MPEHTAEEDSSPMQLEVMLASKLKSLEAELSEMRKQLKESQNSEVSKNQTSKKTNKQTSIGETFF